MAVDPSQNFAKFAHIIEPLFGTITPTKDESAPWPPCAPAGAVVARRTQAGLCEIWHELRNLSDLKPNKGRARVDNNMATCPIWGGNNLAEVGLDGSTAMYRVKHSPRAGGAYEISDLTALADTPDMTDAEKARLTTWLIDQRRQGNEMPMVTREVISYVKSNRPLPVHERADRLLGFIAASAGIVGERVLVDNETLAAYAWSESTAWREVEYFLDYLVGNNWIQGFRSSAGSFNGTVTLFGYNRIAEHETNIGSSQAFVAMWFHASTNEAYDLGIEPAIEDAGYKPLRIDRKPDVDKIDDEIIAGIRRSRFLVADMTHGENGARGGVYYEAGFAHGLGLEVIFSCRKGMEDELHFDTRQYYHIVWETPEDLRAELLNRIRSRIGDGAGKRAAV